MYVQTGSQKKDLGSSRKLSRAKEFSPWQGKAGCGLGDMGGPGMWALYSSVCLTDGRMDPIISWAFPSQPPSVTISRSGAILSFSSLWKALVMFCTFVTSFMQQPFTDPLGVWIYKVIVLFIVFVDLRLESLWCYRLGWICKVAEGARYTSPLLRSPHSYSSPGLLSPAKPHPFGLHDCLHHNAPSFDSF